VFPLKNSPSFSLSLLKGFFAVHLLGILPWVFLSGFLVGSKKPLGDLFLTLAFLCTVLVTTVHLSQFETF